MLDSAGECDPDAPPDPGGAMPEDISYAGYASLTDYLDRKRRERGISRDGLSRALGMSQNYISNLCYRRHRGKTKPPDHMPSVEMCDAIADFFTGPGATRTEQLAERRIVRVLSGKEVPAGDAASQALADRIAALPAADRAVVERVVEGLTATARRARRKT